MSFPTSALRSSIQTASMTRPTSQLGHPAFASSLVFVSMSASVIGNSMLPRACATSALNVSPLAVLTLTRAAPTGIDASASARTRCRNATTAAFPTTASEYSRKPAAPSRNATATL